MLDVMYHSTSWIYPRSADHGIKVVVHLDQVTTVDTDLLNRRRQIPCKRSTHLRDFIAQRLTSGCVVYPSSELGIAQCDGLRLPCKTVLKIAPIERHHRRTLLKTLPQSIEVKIELGYALTQHFKPRCITKQVCYGWWSLRCTALIIRLTTHRDNYTKRNR